MGRSPLHGIRIFSVVAAGLGAIWILYLAYRKVSSRPKMVRDLDSEKDPVLRWGRFGIAFLSWAATWVFVGLFTLLRARIIMISGGSDKSNEWNFGQIVALVTWTPVKINSTWALVGMSFTTFKLSMLTTRAPSMLRHEGDVWS
jgi:hypothetical protein